jgi:uncharacterized damage-inducible protein DinB
MKISDALLPEFDQENAKTRITLERCPEDKFGWKPHEKSFSMGALANHMADMMGWAADTMVQDSFDVAPVGGEPHKMEVTATRKELLEKFDRNISKARAAIAAGSDEDFMKSWSLLAGGNPIFTMPRIAVIRSMIFNHTIHHRGQLTVYLRMNDVAVPAIYGPSADEQG